MTVIYIAVTINLLKMTIFLDSGNVKGLEIEFQVHFTEKNDKFQHSNNVKGHETVLLAHFVEIGYNF